jgi:hypothetical protein
LFLFSCLLGWVRVIFFYHVQNFFFLCPPAGKVSGPDARPF